MYLQNVCLEKYASLDSSEELNTRVYNLIFVLQITRLLLGENFE